jgi:hypothetical protein
MENPRIAVILPAGKIFDRIFTEAIAAAGLGELLRISTDLADPKLQAALATLDSCTTVIADVTARNPHAMFLAGYARALKKPILFITQSAEDFPFSGAPIVYGANTEFLRTELAARLSANRSDPTSTPGENDARAKFLSIFGDLLQKHRYEHRGPVEQNEPTVFTLIDQDMDLALVQEIARRARELNLRVRLM